MPPKMTAVCVPSEEKVVTVPLDNDVISVAFCVSPTVVILVVVLLTVITQLFVFRLADTSVRTLTSVPARQHVTLLVTSDVITDICDVAAVPINVTA